MADPEAGSRQFPVDPGGAEDPTVLVHDPGSRAKLAVSFEVVRDTRPAEPVEFP